MLSVSACLPVLLQDTIVAIRRGGDKLVVANLEAEQYPEIEFGTDPAQACMREPGISNSSSIPWALMLHSVSPLVAAMNAGTEQRQSVTHLRSCHALANVG